jgi:hypothetical protein
VTRNDDDDDDDDDDNNNNNNNNNTCPTASQVLNYNRPIQCTK